MKKILIIEDDFFIKDLYNIAFKKAGYDVTLASDGQAGIDTLRTNKFDIVLLDIMMPKVTGIEVLKTVRDKAFPAHDVPIYLITNLGQSEIIDEAFEIGADGYFLKSQITPHDLVAEVTALLNKESI